MEGQPSFFTQAVHETRISTVYEKLTCSALQVPGSWELPVAARYMVLAQKVDAVIPIGVSLVVMANNMRLPMAHKVLRTGNATSAYPFAF
jgi:hypothetical protein